jgi:hypothetical protein
MATYYVRADGSNANAGTGPGTGQAWQTLSYALGATSGFASGDTLWVAPGIYRELVTVNMTNPTAATYIKGDPSASQFSGVTAGVVRVTNFLTSDSSASSNGIPLDLNDRDYLNFSNLYFDAIRVTTTYIVRFYTATWMSQYTSFTDCIFHSNASMYGISGDGTSPGLGINMTCERCYFNTAVGFFITVPLVTTTYAHNVYFRSCIFDTGGIYLGNTTSANFSQGEGPWEIHNCSFFQGAGISISMPWAITTTAVSVKNCLFHSGFVLGGTTSNVIEDYNLFSTTTPRYTTNAGANSKLGMPLIEVGGYWLNQIKQYRMLTPPSGSSAISLGSSSFTPSGGDFYGNAFSSPPSVGAIEYSTLATGGGLIVHPAMGGGMRG